MFTHSTGGKGFADVGCERVLLCVSAVYPLNFLARRRIQARYDYQEVMYFHIGNKIGTYHLDIITKYGNELLYLPPEERGRNPS